MFGDSSKGEGTSKTKKKRNRKKKKKQKQLSELNSLSVQQNQVVTEEIKGESKSTTNSAEEVLDQPQEEEIEYMIEQDSRTYTWIKEIFHKYNAEEIETENDETILNQELEQIRKSKYTSNNIL